MRKENKNKYNSKPFVFGEKNYSTFEKITNIISKKKEFYITYDISTKESYDKLMIESFFFSCTEYDKRFHDLSKLIENSFYISSHKNTILDMFSKIIRTYNGFRKLLYVFKWNKANKYESNYDLCLNDISHFKSNSLIKILENNTVYTFRISDLIKIINHALTNNCDMFAEPNSIKNPFTNKEISNHNLYNIYYKLKYSHYTTPVLFHLLYLEDFDINKFLFNNEEKIREESIKSYFHGLENNQVKKIFYQMKKKYKNICKINFDKDFPIEIIVESMKPFIFSYLEIKYTMNDYKRSYLKRELKNKINSFVKTNPVFGRKISRVSKSRKRIVEYNCNYVPYKKLKTNEQLYNDVDSDGVDSDSDDSVESSDDNVNIIANHRLETVVAAHEADLLRSSTSNNTNIDNLNNININQINDNHFSLVRHLDQLTLGNVLQQPYAFINYTNTPNENEEGEEGEENNEDSEEDKEENEESDDDEEEIRPFPYNYDSH